MRFCVHENRDTIEFGTEDRARLEELIKAPLPLDVVQRVIELTLEKPPPDTTHWNGRAMEKGSCRKRTKIGCKNILQCG